MKVPKPSCSGFWALNSYRVYSSGAAATVAAAVISHWFRDGGFHLRWTVSGATARWTARLPAVA